MVKAFFLFLILFGLGGTPIVLASGGTLLAPKEETVKSSDPIEMPPYQTEYPDAIPEQETGIIPSPEVPTGTVGIGAGMEKATVPAEENIRSVPPVLVSNILNPNLKEKKKKVVLEPQRTGVVDPELWKKGMEEARRKVQKRIEHAQEEQTEVVLHIEEPEEPKEKNIFLRFLKRLGALFGG